MSSWKMRKGKYKTNLMPQTILITLTIAGTNTGPFDLYSDVDGYVTPFENNVPKAALQAGYVSTLVPDGATIIRVKSDGVCTNQINLTITGTTTSTTSSTTSTTSTTTTAPLCYEFTIENVSLSQQVAYWMDCCTNILSCETIDSGNQITVCSRVIPYGVGIVVTPLLTTCLDCSTPC